MASTRTPLQPAPTLRACHAVGFDAYIVLYREGQEDLARESIYRFARNPELAFSWNDAASMGEQIPYQPECDCDCDCGPAEVTFSVTPYVEPSPFWEWAAATLRVGAVVAPWAILILLCRLAYAKAAGWRW